MNKTTSFIYLLLFLFNCSLFSQSTANYTITVSTIWNAGDHTSIPNDPHWSPLSGATHKNMNDILTFGAPAPLTDGIKDIAERGVTSNFQSEINGNSNANQYLQAGFSPRQAEDSVAELSSVTVSEDFPYITLVSMVAPSPDWFIAVNSENLRSGNPSVNNGWKATFTIDMFAYDAGTDSGTDYESGNSVTNPRENITMVSGAPINGNKMGTITFTYNSSTLSNSNISENIENIRVFPNPASDKITISNIQNTRLKNIEIFSILGKLNHRFLVENNYNKIDLNISNLTSGIYLLKLNNEDGNSKTQKLIVR
ncbi:T9SS type A sorting domain-containing protein [Hyunsoonleella flava]|uniref:T9SS type A sorting domain-containing protein n=1 Tax=Hyunsoonleella flava TaxID=2527939 RepID=A0A4Q9FEE1_9FLAO|nr:spondin domain-containing protein [Hyunsoonleella flava]TBN04731.1 T9SS type A sorting domain-containing protein [Hyunsoonleella flava]